MPEKTVPIFRQCVGCLHWKTLDRFVPLGKLCRYCTEHGTGERHVLIRGYALTDKGRAAAA